MIRVKCDKCGQSYPQKAGHRCPAEGEPTPEANDNVDKGPPVPFDEKQWRREYMRDYMRRRRKRQEPVEPKDQAS